MVTTLDYRGDSSWQCRGGEGTELWGGKGGLEGRALYCEKPNTLGPGGQGQQQWS